MKRVGYLLFCLCLAARAAVGSQRPLRLAATAARKPSWFRIWLQRSVTLMLDALLLGTAAILLLLRLVDTKFINSISNPLLSAGTDPRQDSAALREPVPAELEGNSAAGVSLPVPAADTVGFDSPGAPSRLQALREVLFADGLPDLRGIGRNGDGSAPHPLAVAESQPVEPPQAKQEAPPVSPQPVALPLRSHPRLPSNRLERGEPLDEIQVLPSLPGQYRRKTE